MVESSGPRTPRSTAFSVFCTRPNTSTACARVQANLNSAVYRLYPYTNLKFKPNLAPRVQTPCRPTTQKRDKNISLTLPLL